MRTGPIKIWHMDSTIQLARMLNIKIFKKILTQLIVKVTTEWDRQNVTYNIKVLTQGMAIEQQSENASTFSITYTFGQNSQIISINI